VIRLGKFSRRGLMNLSPALGCSKMKMRRYKQFLIGPYFSEHKDGSGWTAEFLLLKDDANGVTETQFLLPNTFKSEDDALNAVWSAASHTIDNGFQPSL